MKGNKKRTNLLIRPESRLPSGEAEVTSQPLRHPTGAEVMDEASEVERFFHADPSEEILNDRSAIVNNAIGDQQAVARTA